MSVAGHMLILIGAFFLFLGALGIVRMPDVYNRLQAGTKATTLGAMLLFIGVGITDVSFLPKALLLVVFTALGNPIVSSLIARSAHRNGVKLTQKTQFDKCPEDCAEEETLPEAGK